LAGICPGLVSAKVKNPFQIWIKAGQGHDALRICFSKYLQDKIMIDEQTKIWHYQNSLHFILSTVFSY